MKDQPVSEERFWEMLGVLPPERAVHNAFLVGEPSDHAPDLSGHFGARYRLYFEEDGRHYDGGLASVRDFDVFTIDKE